MKYDVLIKALQNTRVALGIIVDALADEVPKETEKQETKHTFEEVRGVLAKLSADGYTADVKAILTKFNCKKLSDVKEDDYEAVLQEAEKICRH